MPDFRIRLIKTPLVGPKKLFKSVRNEYIRTIGYWCGGFLTVKKLFE